MPMVSNNIQGFFSCTMCCHGRVWYRLSSKDTNKENVKETNYTNVYCDICRQAYAIKVVIEERK